VPGRAFTQTIRLSNEHVYRIHVKELKSHMDVGILFENLPTLTDFGIVYGHRRVGMDYERSMFGMKNADATCLAKAIKYKSKLLTMVDLSSNLMDDDKLRLLVTGLLDNDTVTHIDVSHNRVADRGARALARLLGETSVITSLNLCDNEVHGEGGKALGRVLTRNRSLLSLNLRLNRLGDDGGRLLAEGLRANRALRELNCCGNAFAVEVRFTHAA
jgi:Ran GTPase-activating protein (RanGAP) involved in mRNA processing and transport